MFKYGKSIFVFCFCFTIINVFLVFNVYSAETINEFTSYDNISGRYGKICYTNIYNATISSVDVKLKCVEAEDCYLNNDELSIFFSDIDDNIIYPQYYNINNEIVFYDTIIDINFVTDISIPNEYCLNFDLSNVQFVISGSVQTVENCNFEEEGFCGYNIIKGDYNNITPKFTAIGALGAMADPLINNSLQFLVIIFSDYWAYLMILTIISILILYIINFVNKIIK